MNPSTALARVLIDELIANGITDAVLAPGSRSAPLSMALFEADAAGRLRLHVRIDERGAGFLALGLARSTGRPVPVATTSGTAVANLHPAVLEARHDAVPVLVLSADRPPQLRDVGANQVIDQRTVFGSALRFFHEFEVPGRVSGQNGRWRAMVCRALAHAAGPAGVPGPVQLNLPLDTPLLPDSDGDWPEPLTGRSGPWTTFPAGAVPAAVPGPQPGEKVLFVADLTHPWAGSIAAQGQLVVAEAGGAAGGQVLSAGIHLLGHKGFLEANRPDRVIVLGRPTLYRQVSALLADPGLPVDVVAAPDLFPDPAGTARLVAPAIGRPEGEVPPEFAEAWRHADRVTRRAVADLVAAQSINGSARLAAELVAALPDGATLVLGSSQLPRDVGQASAPRDGLRVLANRGVAGIDGTNATAIGVALGAPGPTVALLGDLAFLHDLSSLVIGPHEPRPDLTIVVGNNDGGGIFHTLEPGDPLHASAFERVFGTPHGAVLADLAAGAGAEHVLVSTTDELAEAIDAPSGIRVVEVPIGRTDLRAVQADYRDAVNRALAG